jgi:proliferating cell nuclear antigen
MDQPGNIIYIRTIQAHIFGLLNEALKDILYEVNLEITPGGICIKEVNNSHSQFVHLQLHANKFETFICHKPMTLGVDMIYLYKLLRGVGNNETLVLSVNESNTSLLKICIFNDDTGINKEYSLKLLDIDEQQHQKLPVADDVTKFVLSISTQKFKSICKELSVISDIIEITCTKREIRFECNGSSAKGLQQIDLSKINPHAFIVHDCNEIVQGIFSLKTLCQFTKFSNMCSHVELHVANDEPIMVKYMCSDLGSISLYLAPYDNI